MSSPDRFEFDPDEPELPWWGWVLAFCVIFSLGFWLYQINSGVSP